MLLLLLLLLQEILIIRKCQRRLMKHIEKADIQHK